MKASPAGKHYDDISPLWARENVLANAEATLRLEP